LNGANAVGVRSRLGIRLHISQKHRFHLRSLDAWLSCDALPRTRRDL
jgi:hypothetical protein